MSKRIGKFANVSKREQALSLVDGGSVTGTLTSTGAATFSSTVNCEVGIQNAAVARTATADGTTTGTIADGTSHVTVTSGGVNTIIILPTPTPGNIVYLSEAGTTGYEIRSSTPASIAINGGTASNGESAVDGAVTYVKCVCTSATSWICSQYDADGDESKLDAAA